MNEPTTPPDQASSPEREIPTTGSPASTAVSASTTGSAPVTGSAPATGFPDSGAAVPASAPGSPGSAAGSPGSAAGSPGSAAGSPGSAAAYDPAGRAAAAERSVAARAMVARLHQLAAALTARGLTVSVGQDSLLARNPAASDTDDPRGRALNPGLSQTVAIAARDDGTLHFHWCWSGATRGAPMELEYMTPAHDIDGAARRIARVLAVTGE